MLGYPPGALNAHAQISQSALRKGTLSQPVCKARRTPRPPILGSEAPRAGLRALGSLHQYPPKQAGSGGNRDPAAPFPRLGPVACGLRPSLCMGYLRLPNPGVSTRCAPGSSPFPQPQGRGVREAPLASSRRRGEGGCPGRKKQSPCPWRAPRPGPLLPREPGARHPQLGAQCGHTHPPCPSRRRLRRHSLREPPSPELPKRKKDGGVCRETTHSSVWQPGGDSGSSAQKEEEEEGTAQSNAICCTPQRCHWPPGASPGAAGRGPPGATLRLAARGSCSPPPFPSSSSPSPGGCTHPTLRSARTPRRESRARWPQARLLRSPRVFSATLNLRGAGADRAKGLPCRPEPRVPKPQLAADRGKRFAPRGSKK